MGWGWRHCCWWCPPAWPPRPRPMPSWCSLPRWYCCTRCGAPSRSWPTHERGTAPRVSIMEAPTMVAVDPVLEALPVGVGIVDRHRRIVYMNPAFHASLDLPPNSVLPGTPVEDAVRAAAHRGVYGPGDPEAQVAAV